MKKQFGVTSSSDDHQLSSPTAELRFHYHFVCKSKNRFSRRSRSPQRRNTISCIFSPHSTHHRRSSKISLKFNILSRLICVREKNYKFQFKINSHDFWYSFRLASFTWSSRELFSLESHGLSRLNLIWLFGPINLHRCTLLTHVVRRRALRLYSSSFITFTSARLLSLSFADNIKLPCPSAFFACRCM